MMRSMYLVCWLALAVASMLVGPNYANAQGSPEARQACAPDAMRLCADFIPDVPKITKCMVHKYPQLSQPCRLAMSHGQKSHAQKTYVHYKKKSVEMCWGMPCNR